MADPINPVTPQESANLKPFTLPAAPTEQAIKTQFGGVPGIDMTKAPKSLGGVQQEEARVLQRQQQLGQDIGANELAQKQYQADVQASIATQERERTQAIEAKVDQVRKDFPYPELHPTKENIPELATLFSLIGVIGMAVGGAGKMSAIGSMNSMSGMMKGWQQGRSDLWNREKQEFDKEMTKVKSIIDDAYKDADRAYKMMATDRREAEALANQSAAKMGGQIGKQILEKQGLEPYFKYLQEIKGDINKVLRYCNQERERTQAIEAKVDQVSEDLPYPELHPTKENIAELATLFSLIGVIGMAVGGAGKMSAIGSMNSMSGMMKGWQQGRSDLWNREKQEFDKEMTKVKSIIDDAYKDADRAYKMMATDRREAEALANQSAAKMGGQIGKQILEKQGLEPYFKYLQEIKGDINKVLDRAVKTSKSVEGALPKDSKTRDEFRARYQAVKNVEDIQSLLDNPKYAKFINPTTGFTPAVINNLRENFPELSSKLARIQAIEFQIGGKALTKNEQAILEPLYGWKGLTTDALKERLKEVKDNFNKTNGLVEIDYPGLKSLRGKYDQYYEQTGKVPEVPAPESAIYSVGDIVQKGEKRFKVTGVIKDGQGNIVDYDVDEVKAK